MTMPTRFGSPQHRTNSHYEVCCVGLLKVSGGGGLSALQVIHLMRWDAPPHRPNRNNPRQAGVTLSHLPSVCVSFSMHTGHAIQASDLCVDASPCDWSVTSGTVWCATFTGPLRQTLTFPIKWQGLGKTRRRITHGWGQFTIFPGDNLGGEAKHQEQC